MPEPVSVGLGLLVAKFATGAATKGALVGGAKAGTAVGAKAGCAKAAAGAVKATHGATVYAATYGPGAIGATATSAILGTCVATSTMLAVAACLSQTVRLHGMSEESARRYCRKVGEKRPDEQRVILRELEQAPPGEVTSVLSKHGIFSRATYLLGAAVIGIAVVLT